MSKEIVGGSPEQESLGVDENDFINDTIFEGIGDDTEEEIGESESVDESEDFDPDELANAEEAKRREEQSFKDKYYALLEKEKGESRVQTQTVPTQQPVGDPILNELQPYIQQLNKLVVEGDITEEDAKLRLQEQYVIRKQTHDLQNNYVNSFSKIRGSENVSLLKSELQKNGIELGSDAEREAVSLLKSHWKLDINDPSTFANMTDPTGISNLALYVSAVALQKQSQRNGTERQAPKANKGTRSVSKTPATAGKTYGSLSDVSEAARRGLLK